MIVPTPIRPRSVLFVPGDRPDRFEKALVSGADAICLDLEDAVAVDRKAAARREVFDFLETERPEMAVSIIVRINAVGLPDGRADLQDLAGLPRPPLLMLPKVEESKSISDAASLLGCPNAGIIALIESARGLRQAADIAAAPGVIALALGSVDLAAQLGAVFDPAALSTLRLMFRLAAAEADVAVLDGPTLDIHDAAAVERSATEAAALGFDGKLAIHPAQIQPIHVAFSASSDQVAAARRIVDQAKESVGAFQLDGRMIDAPVIAAAHRLLARAGEN